MTLHVPATATHATMTASISPAITETELDQALRQCYPRKLAVPATVCF